MPSPEECGPCGQAKECGPCGQAEECVSCGQVLGPEVMRMRPWMWVVWLVVGILVVVLITELANAIPKYLNNIEGAAVQGPLLNPYMCIILDMFVYLLIGMAYFIEYVPTVAVVLYILIFELVTQSVASKYYPQYFEASTFKSIVDVIMCVFAFTLGRWLQIRARKQGWRPGPKRSFWF